MSGPGGTSPATTAGVKRPMCSGSNFPSDRRSLPDVRDGELVTALRQGDEQAFERLVRVHGRWMLALATRFLGSERDAADVVQDSFLSAFRSLPSFRGEARLTTWLRAIVVNHALMRLRSNRRKPEQSLDALLPEFLPDGHQARPTPSWAELPDLLFARKEAREVVRRCIDELPERYRTVLLLRDIEDLDTQEVADFLHISPNCVKVRLHRARQALKALLDRHFLKTHRPTDSPLSTLL